ncbi:MAG: urease accessory protein UreE [Gammaproteobacteria bacterium]|nr:urease accessory protein UreE [Gammaproteobacteria bacterium]MCP5200096.1 urease accessory protein UreE [Gammaproteobacteria bacterium]
MSLPLLDRVTDAAREPDDILELPFADRARTRQRVRLASGREAGLDLPRGTVLRDGDRIAGGNLVVEVRAAPETVSVVRAAAPRLLRAAYHLGNRHVAVEIGCGWLAYLHDHVLDDMLRGLGLEPACAMQAFEPEGGAYGGHGHGGAHGHAHAHGHEHGQAHGHAHAHDAGHADPHARDGEPEHRHPRRHAGGHRHA